MEAFEPLYIRVIEAKRRPIDAGWDAAGVRSAFWRGYVNDRHGPALRLAGAPAEPWPIPPHAVVLVPAGVGFSCLNTRRVDHAFVHFDVSGLPLPLVRELFPRPMVVPAARGSEAAARFREAVTEATRRPDPVSWLRVQSVAGEALGRALEARRDHERLAFWFSGSPRLRPAFRYIEGHLGEALPVATLARTCHLSGGHFSRLFRRATGQTPARFVLERRIARAAELLAFSDRPIESIATSVGFSDRFHFSRVFARLMGLPPARYRRREPV